ncbi:hypothetical protein AB0J52_00300 [Spirillospora sp. NPDC049652]
MKKVVTLPLGVLTGLVAWLLNAAPSLVMRLCLLGWITLAVSALVGDGLAALPVVLVAFGGAAFTRFLLDDLDDGELW